MLCVGVEGKEQEFLVRKVKIKIKIKRVSSDG